MDPGRRGGRPGRMEEGVDGGVKVRDSIWGSDIDSFFGEGGFR